MTEGADLISSPLWSYDGKYLAYLAKSKTGNQQTCMWIFDTADNALYRLLTLKQDIMSFKWSPDGSRIAFIAGDIDHKSDAATTKLIDVSRSHLNMRLYSIAVSRKENPEIKAMTPADYSVNCDPATQILTGRLMADLSLSHFSRVRIFNIHSFAELQLLTVRHSR